MCSLLTSYTQLILILDRLASSNDSFTAYKIRSYYILILTEWSIQETQLRLTKPNNALIHGLINAERKVNFEIDCKTLCVIQPIVSSSTPTSRFWCQKLSCFVEPVLAYFLCAVVKHFKNSFANFFFVIVVITAEDSVLFGVIIIVVITSDNVVSFVIVVTSW